MLFMRLSIPAAIALRLSIVVLVSVDPEDGFRRHLVKLKKEQDAPFWFRYLT